MSDGGTKSLQGDASSQDDFAGTEVIIVEGFAKFRDVKRWKQRYCVLTKLSPAAGKNTLLIYLQFAMLCALFHSAVAFKNAYPSS